MISFLRRLLLRPRPDYSRFDPKSQDFAGLLRWWVCHRCRNLQHAARRLGVHPSQVICWCNGFGQPPAWCSSTYAYRMRLSPLRLRQLLISDQKTMPAERTI